MIIIMKIRSIQNCIKNVNLLKIAFFQSLNPTINFHKSCNYSFEPLIGKLLILKPTRYL